MNMDDMRPVYAALAEEDLKKVMDRFGGKQFSDLKKGLADVAVAKLAPITARMRKLMGDKKGLDTLLAAGNEHAASIAEKTLRETREKMGFWQ